jgi:hypothetical protein
MKSLTRYRWTALALVAIALVAAIRFLDSSETVERGGLTFAGPALARALESNGDKPGTRVLATFVEGGAPCHAFLGSEVSGIACKERGGWHLRLIRDGVDLGDPEAVAATERDVVAAAARMEAQ